MKSPYKFIAVLFAVILSFGLGIVTNQIIIEKSRPEEKQYNFQSGAINTDYVNGILGLLNDEYLNTVPSGDKLTYGAIKGIVESLGDKYTSFLTPDEAKEYLASANNEFEGIGVTLSADQKSHITTIETVLTGYPAEKAGVMPGDVILKVDGVDVATKVPAEVATLIRGKAGTGVNIDLYRPKTDKTIKLALTREKIDLPNMEWKMVNGNVAVINIYKFTEDSVANFNHNWDKLVADVTAHDPKYIIVDLRNNPGGYVDSVKYVAEEFLTDGQTIFTEETKAGRDLKAVDERKGAFENIPMVVLVNEGSASAAEIFSGAIQDNHRGLIIGQKTVGKGVEQKLIDIKDGSMLVMVFRKWLTPAGRNISPQQSITPDQIIDENDSKPGDEQMDKALELVQKK